MADAARSRLADYDLEAEIDVLDDASAYQRGEAFALFADLAGGARLGADGAGAPGRLAETIGDAVARRLVEDLTSGATIDRFAADQLLPFAALAEGTTRLCIPRVTPHVETSAWLAELFVGADVHLEDRLLVVRGSGRRQRRS